MGLISMPGPTEFAIIGFMLAYWAFIIGTIIGILKRADIELTPRLLWTLIILCAPVIGIILYNFVGRPVSDKAYK